MSHERLGVFGGSFDPIHNGHLAMAALAREHLALSHVLFIPAGVPPHKKHTVHAPADHRLAMLQLAFKGVPGTSVYRGEVDRDGPSYTVDTLAAISLDHPEAELFFLIGSDNLAEVPTWRRYREILSSVILCVSHRPGHASRRPSELAGARIVHCPSPEWALSSTMVRAYISEGHACAGLLHPAVRSYIDEKGLYRS